MPDRRARRAEEALALGIVAAVDEDAGTAALRVAERIAAVPRAATIELKRRVLLGGEHTWLPLLADESRVLRETLLGPANTERSRKPHGGEAGRQP